MLENLMCKSVFRSCVIRLEILKDYYRKLAHEKKIVIRGLNI